MDVKGLCKILFKMRGMIKVDVFRCKMEQVYLLSHM